LLLNEEEMLEVESVHCGQNTTGTTLVLIDSIVEFFVEIEALRPRVVEVCVFLLEEELFYASDLLV
jgi:hypothetical protein